MMAHKEAFHHPVSYFIPNVINHTTSTTSIPSCSVILLNTLRIAIKNLERSHSIWIYRAWAARRGSIILYQILQTDLAKRGKHVVTTQLQKERREILHICIHRASVTWGRKLPITLVIVGCTCIDFLSVHHIAWAILARSPAFWLHQPAAWVTQPCTLLLISWNTELQLRTWHCSLNFTFRGRASQHERQLWPTTESIEYGSQPSVRQQACIWSADVRTTAVSHQWGEEEARTPRRTESSRIGELRYYTKVEGRHR